jgi:hypothetical protein
MEAALGWARLTNAAHNLLRLWPHTTTPQAA